jgi:hypothetical protein
VRRCGAWVSPFRRCPEMAVGNGSTCWYHSKVAADLLDVSEDGERARHRVERTGHDGQAGRAGHEKRKGLAPR